ncbi:hypothetical protein CLUG_04092 [Clavispora lusitaniae ATCC 42720]|uniref:Gamma-glutamyltransferase n=2 Tax=Clavispora lusitaniae TaxID=36911 RepID=C4Y4V4_CLAL4|nr:uncharacterized protein CLUG_04092 [Clavispora lusitaniae ATCC 42720]EEQ39964.1 hypothetical protein CLUG_04092 [Clavispora lusitaniae ATCC 42720]OVF10625.1 putative gamma-glutamyltransferase [Clavispora lusitaniae]
MFDRFKSRRSVVHSTKGLVASSQPLANAAGIRVLEKGGNCVDAAVAVSAALCVTEPPSTGIGGDCFVLFYEKDTKKVHGLNGCGKSPQYTSIDRVRKDIPTGARIPYESVHAVTVPGAVAGWLDAIELWGSGNVNIADILQPAIELAEEGFPVSDISAHLWREASEKLVKQSGDNANMFVNEDGSFCEAGQVFRNVPLARIFRLIAQYGKRGFYEGEVADKIVSEIQSRGGFLEMEDLANHTSKIVDPICMDFEGKTLWEIPPNGQGIVALLALGYIKEFIKRENIDLRDLGHNSTEYLNILIEALKLAFYDSEHLVADTDFHKIDVERALSTEYLSQRCKLLQSQRILTREHIDEVPNPMFKCDTVYFSVADKDGNACSFINSVFSSFGSGIIPEGCGFALQSRGANFNLTENAVNCLEGGKRPFHTIIPSLITETENGELFASVACMGGWQQPQAHVQIMLNMTVFGFNPQEALDAPRFCLEPNEEYRHLDRGFGSSGPISTPATLVNLEDGISPDVAEALADKGHVVKIVSGYDRSIFGRGQCILNNSTNEQIVWSGGSDQRGDGAAVPQL